MKTFSAAFMLSVWGAFSAGSGLGATSVGIQEPVPSRSKSGQVPVTLASDTAVVALQADVQFSAAQYVASPALAGSQPDGVHVESAEIEPGVLRVVVYHRSHGALAGDVMFRLPLEAKSGVVADSPVILTNLIVAGQNGASIATGIQPTVRLVNLRDDQKVNGRFGVELSANVAATGGTIQKVEYYVGGVLVGEGLGSTYSFLWMPTESGPFEITAIAYDSNGFQASTRTIPILVSHVGTYDGPVLGTYAGLVRAPSFSFSQEGYASMTSTTKGAFTLKLLMGGKTLSGKGQFDAAGNATVSLSRGKGVSPLTVVLAHSSDPQVDQIHGRVADGPFANGRFSGHSFQSEFVADRMIWNAKTLPATQKGSYTVLLPFSESAVAEGAPLGTGFATAVVAPAGTVKATLTLADGTKATVSSQVSKDGTWPLYASLYKNQGVLLGEMKFESAEGVGDVEGDLDWSRPADAKAALFKPGFLTQAPAVGGLFVKPLVNQTLVPAANLGGNLNVFLSNGGLADTMAELATLQSTNKALVPLQSALRTTFLPVGSSGLMSGSFFHPDTQKSVKYQGVVLQEQGLFAGFFLGTGQAGDVRVAANGELPENAGDPLGEKPLPVVKITAPKANSTLKEVVGGAVQVTGTAADKQGIEEVTYQVLHNGVLSAPAAATGTTGWSFEIPVGSGEGGLYVVHVKATDTAGDESDVVTAQFWTPLKGDLNITVNGPGTVAKGFEGTSQRDVGKLVTIAAKPNAKKKFLGWTGSVVSSAPTLTVLMEDSLTLQANFGD